MATILNNQLLQEADYYNKSSSCLVAYYGLIENMHIRKSLYMLFLFHIQLMSTLLVDFLFAMTYIRDKIISYIKFEKHRDCTSYLVSSWDVDFFCPPQIPLCCMSSEELPMGSSKALGQVSLNNTTQFICKMEVAGGSKYLKQRKTVSVYLPWEHCGWKLFYWTWKRCHIPSCTIDRFRLSGHVKSDRMKLSINPSTGFLTQSITVV